MCLEKKGKKDETKEEEDEVPAGIFPTRPMSSYLYFSNEMVPKLKQDEGIAHKAAMSRAGVLWGQMSAADKKPYEDLNAKDAQR